MGTSIMFVDFAEGTDPQEAFRKAVADAYHDHGHSGCTGSVAEKDGEGFVLYEPADAAAFLSRLLPSEELRECLGGLSDAAAEGVSEGDRLLAERADDETSSAYGPAGCVAYLGGWAFWGWADA